MPILTPYELEEIVEIVSEMKLDGLVVISFNKDELEFTFEFVRDVTLEDKAYMIEFMENNCLEEYIDYIELSGQRMIDLVIL